MDGPVYVRQKSISSTAGAASPVASPAHRHARSGSTGVANFRRTQNYAAKAAAQRLAQVMATQRADDDDDDDLSFDYNSSNVSSGIGLPAGRPLRSPSPAKGPNLVDHNPSVRSAFTGRPSISVKPTPMVPPSKPALRPRSSVPPTEPSIDGRKGKRYSADLGNSNTQETESQRSASFLEDEIDMLQEENDNILVKLRLAEERCEEAEARARQLEKQVATLGEGVSLEARLLSRKEAALQQREAALKAAAQNYVREEEVSSFRVEAEAAKEEAMSYAERLQDAECEVKSLRSMSLRMLLTKEEMEEVVLKRCWLAWNWSLCVRHGIHAEIAEKKHEYWSSLAPLPREVIISAGQKAKEESCKGKDNAGEGDKIGRDLNDLTGEGNIESMLLVEKGLRELVSLKVADAVMLAMAQHRRPNLVRPCQPIAETIESQNLVEAFELSQEESDDVLFKQSWLIYFWRRAKDHGLEEDIADERLQFWINQNSRSPTSHDAVDVERGLAELNKLGIESQLWEVARKETVNDLSMHSDTEL